MDSRSSAVDRMLLLLRVCVGIGFVLHGWGKVREAGGFAAANGVPVFLGTAAAQVQCIGGLLLVVGLLTPVAALGDLRHDGGRHRHARPSGRIVHQPWRPQWRAQRCMPS
jgi:hypothetical protein